MRIIYLSNQRLPTEKAYGIQIAKMCKAFADNGHHVFLIAPYRISKIKGGFFKYFGIEENFRFKKILVPDLYLPGTLNKLAFAVKSFISALVLVLYSLFLKTDLFYSRDELVVFLLSYFKKNIIFEVHRYSQSRSLLYKRFIKKGIKTAAISNGIKEELIRTGFRPEKILIAPDGVDLNQFDLPISQSEAREKINLPLDPKIIMYTGHLFEWKGAGTLLQVAKNFQFSIFNFQKNQGKVLFVFVGGTDYDIKKFRKKTEGLDNVLILGHKPHSQIPAYLKAADILILPNSAKEDISSKYTSPLKLFEYMASGRPIVASALPSIMEILNDRNAVLVKPDDSSNLAEGITKILNNNIVSEEIAKKALEDVREYAWQKRAEKIVDFIGMTSINKKDLS